LVIFSSPFVFWILFADTTAIFVGSQIYYPGGFSPSVIFVLGKSDKSNERLG